MKLTLSRVSAKLSLGLPFVLLTSCSMLMPEDRYAYIDGTDQVSSIDGKEQSQEYTYENHGTNTAGEDGESDLFTTTNQENIDHWEQVYSKTKNRERLLRQMQNGEKYKDIIEDILAFHEVPKDIYYLGMIESGYHAKAKSHAKASGPWQFMAGTAKRYGLIINKHIDERFNIVKSTHAAARYLKDLYKMFDDWKLAFAGYNAGEMRIVRAIEKAQSKDFDTLVELKYLPTETQHYVPKYLVVKRLVEQIKNEEEIGWDWDRWDMLHPIEVDRAISVEALAKKSGLSAKEIKEHNPQLLSNIIPGSKKQSIQIFMPQEQANRIALALPEVPASILKDPIIQRFSRSRSAKFKVHRVRAGDSLWHLAKVYGVSVNNIMRWNNLKSKRLSVGLKLKVAAAS